METMKALVEALGLQKSVEFTGFVADLSQALAAMDVFVAPSLTEGFPLALMEAMTAELPIAASFVGGIPEMITPGETGVLFPPGDPKALAEAVIATLADYEKAVQMAKKGKTWIRREFTPEKYIQKIDALYQELLEAKGLA